MVALTEAFDLLNRTYERYYEAEAHRIKGELLRKAGGLNAEAEAAESFHQGAEVA